MPANSSSTASVRSSVYDYIEENGRRYHKYKEGREYFSHYQEMDLTRVEYLLPNDEVRSFLSI
jgi:hypothetical protein